MKVTTITLLAVFAAIAAAGEPQETPGETNQLRPAVPVISRPERKPVLPTVPPPDSFTPMTVVEKYQHNFYRTFDANATIRTLATTSLDLALDNPEGWPGGFEGYGIRYASKTGRRLSKRMIMSTVQATLGHDPRRLPTTSETIWGRAGQAFLNTYRSRTDSGGVTFNYSRLLGAYGAGFISRSWHPPGARHSSDAWINGTTTMAIDGATAIFWEFWPDIKKKIFRRR